MMHPLVSSMYLKKDYGNLDRSRDVLVIETNFSRNTNNDHEYNSCLAVLLGDLRNLQKQAEKRLGSFDRIDIRKG